MCTRWIIVLYKKADPPLKSTCSIIPFIQNSRKYKLVYNGGKHLSSGLEWEGAITERLKETFGCDDMFIIFIAVMT